MVEKDGGAIFQRSTNLDASTGLFRMRPITSISLHEHRYLGGTKKNSGTLISTQLRRLRLRGLRRGLMRSIAHLQHAIIDDGCIARRIGFRSTHGRVENEENKRVNRKRSTRTGTVLLAFKRSERRTLRLREPVCGAVSSAG